MSVAVEPDVAGDLRRIHAVITRGLTVSMLYCDRPAADSADRAASEREGFLAYVHALVGLLRAHHLAEDEVAFPRVRALIPEMPYDRLTAEHQQVDALLREIAGVVPGASGVEPQPTKQELGTVLARLSILWHPHIAQEELHLTRDRIEQTLSPEEHASLSDEIRQHSQAHATPDYLVLPFMLYNLPPDARALMASHLPPIVTERLLPIVWADKWTPMKPFLLSD